MNDQAKKKIKQSYAELRQPKEQISGIPEVDFVH
jgi:hypothetical protein